MHNIYTFLQIYKIKMILLLTLRSDCAKINKRSKMNIYFGV